MLFYFSFFILRERASRERAERGGETERIPTRFHILSAPSLTWGSIPQTLRSWPEPKSKVWCSTDRATRRAEFNKFYFWCLHTFHINHNNVLPFLNILFLFNYFLNVYLFILRERAWAEKGQRDRETENLKQAPLSAQASHSTQSHQPWDQDLSQNQESVVQPTGPPRHP